MKDLAIAKLDKELKALKKPSQHIKVMMKPVHDALVTFCQQDEEFAQAICQGESFSACMEAVAKNAGSAISDLEAYRRAVQFYFPGADIRMQMTIRVNPHEDVSEEALQERRQDSVILDLFDLMGG